MNFITALDHEPVAEPLSLRAAFVRLLGLGKRYLPFYMTLCLLALISSAAGTAIAEMLRLIVDAAVDKNSHLLITALILGIGLIVIMAASELASSLVSTIVDNRSVLWLQALLQQKLLRLPMAHLRTFHSADLLSRVHDSAYLAQSALNQQGVKLFRNVTYFFMLLAYLVYVSPLLAIGAVVIAIVLPLAIAPLSRRMGVLYGQRQEAQAAEQGFVQESIQGMELIKSHTLWSTIEKRYLTFSDRTLHLNRRVMIGESILWRAQMLIFVVGLLYALGFGGYLVAKGQLDIGGIAGFLVAFMNLLQPISEISTLWPQFQNAIVQSRRVFAVLDLPEDPVAAVTDEHSLRHDDVAGADIRLCNIGFGYVSGEQVLRGFTLHVPAGKTTALVGPSGGGKSTLIQLLLRFYQADTGELLLGDRQLESLVATEWRAQIGYVPQDTLVFAGSLYDNILLGRPTATRTEVLKAATMARVDDFVSALPRGYDTHIGERGLLLSGGERQRLALARALVREPALLILDEPTSALDSENEALVQAALDQAMQGRTTIVVAHRLSTVRHADQIAFVRDGRVLECGSHEELMRTRGAYFALHQASQTLQASNHAEQEVIA